MGFDCARLLGRERLESRKRTVDGAKYADISVVRLSVVKHGLLVNSVVLVLL